MDMGIEHLYKHVFIHCDKSRIRIVYGYIHIHREKNANGKFKSRKKTSNIHLVIEARRRWHWQEEETWRKHNQKNFHINEFAKCKMFFFCSPFCFEIGQYEQWAASNVKHRAAHPVNQSKLPHGGLVMMFWHITVQCHIRITYKNIFSIKCLRFAFYKHRLTDGPLEFIKCVYHVPTHTHPCIPVNTCTIRWFLFLPVDVLLFRIVVTNF